MGVQVSIEGQVVDLAKACIEIIRGKGFPDAKVAYHCAPNFERGGYRIGVAVCVGEWRHAAIVCEDALAKASLAAEIAEMLLEAMNGPDGVKRAECA